MLLRLTGTPSARPGTGEDFVLETGIGTSPPSSLSVQTAVAGDLLTLRVRSPNGAFAASPYGLVAQLFATSGPDPVGIGPALHFDSGAVLVFATFGGVLPGVLGTGAQFGFAIPPSMKNGMGAAMMRQKFSQKPSMA